MTLLTQDQATFELKVPGLFDPPVTLRGFAIEDPSELIGPVEEIGIGCAEGGLSVGCYTGPVRQRLVMEEASADRERLEAWLAHQQKHAGAIQADARITRIPCGPEYLCTRGSLSRISTLEYELTWHAIADADQI